ncbi:MAG TPA: DNA primase [Casimicrobiaceae bacterium]|nr:DNA primase [Casimicrobiaceae bacterium]
MIPHEFIQTLLSRVDIVAVVDRYVPLKKAGTNFVACCPFHSEKTPSFTVSPTKQFYHCFGCGAHGTAISFLMEFGGKPFPDAVEELARDAGLEVPRTQVAPAAGGREEALDLSGVLLQAAKFYRLQLKESERAIAYLKGRGLSGPVAARFGIGYAPDDWQPLAGAFPDYQSKVLETAGLVIAGDAGKRYDRFRDRIMFPIHDGSGRVIGFGGRVLDKGEPKYLNSPETPVFSKGRELYGMFQARPAIRAAARVVVVEGYMDVVALAQHGVEFAVATLGTATTATHAQKLFRVTDTVIFCFDGDDAGRRAAWRALENTLSVLADGKDARFLFLPDGEDPDDYIRQRGKSAFEALLNQATPLSDFLLSELAARHPPRSAEGRAALVHAAKPLLAQLNAQVFGALLRQRLAELAGLPEREMTALLPPQKAAPAAPPVRGGGLSRPAPSLIRGLIQCVLLQPELVRRIPVPKPLGANVDGAALAALVAFCETGKAPLTTAGVMQHFAGGTYEDLFVAALTSAESEGLTAELLETELVEAVNRYWLNARKRGDDAESRRGPPVDLSVEETERARQLQLARDQLGGGAPS